MEYVTDGGLVVTDRRHSRATEFPQVDPRTHDPNDGPNALSTVGPQSRPGEVMPEPWPQPEHARAQVLHAESWGGWPDSWATPFAGGVDTLPVRVSTAMSCIDLNSRQLASFPVYGVKDTVPVPLPSWSINPEPELYASWGDFMHAAVNSLLARGDVFTVATGRYANGYPSRFVTLNPDAVGIEWLDGHLEYLVDGIPLNREDVCHVRYQTWPGRLRGIAPIDWIGRSMITSSALESYATNLATRGGVPWGVLKVNKEISDVQATDAQNSWVNASARRDGAPAVLGNAFDLEVLSFSPEQMALLELREFDERRICAAFGVPAYLVNVAMAGSLTYANASQLFAHHWASCLRPLAQLLSDAWSSWLLPAGTNIEFNPDRYVQPPLGERAQAYATLFGIVDPTTGQRAIHVDEIRSAERFGPSPNPSPTQTGRGLT